jgi:hypothetical protein
LLILDQWDISSHVVVVFDLGKNLLFECILSSIVGPCVLEEIKCTMHVALSKWPLKQIKPVQALRAIYVLCNDQR